MKVNSIYIVIFFCLAISIGLGFSCNTVKKSAQESRLLYITLTEGQDKNYLINKYSDYSPKAVSKSNKTKNQYRAEFYCTPIDYSTLKASLKNDKNVLTFLDSSPSEIKIQSGTNNKHAKTKSIRDKN